MGAQHLHRLLLLQRSKLGLPLGPRIRLAAVHHQAVTQLQYRGVDHAQHGDALGAPLRLRSGICVRDQVHQLAKENLPVPQKANPNVEHAVDNVPSDLVAVVAIHEIQQVFQPAAVGLVQALLGCVVRDGVADPKHQPKQLCCLSTHAGVHVHNLSQQGVNVIAGQKGALRVHSVHRREQLHRLRRNAGLSISGHLQDARLEVQGKLPHPLRQLGFIDLKCHPNRHYGSLADPWVFVAEVPAHVLGAVVVKEELWVFGNPVPEALIGARPQEVVVVSVTHNEDVLEVNLQKAFHSLELLPSCCRSAGCQLLLQGMGHLNQPIHNRVGRHHRSVPEAPHSCAGHSGEPVFQQAHNIRLPQHRPASVQHKLPPQLGEPLGKLPASLG
eukprot:RCo032877